MNICESLNHTKWECKYHVISCHLDPEVPAPVAVWVVAAALGEGVRELARPKECEIEEGHLMVDQMHSPMSD
jgi:putative transposase